MNDLGPFDVRYGVREHVMFADIDMVNDLNGLGLQ